MLRGFGGRLAEGLCQRALDAPSHVQSVEEAFIFDAKPARPLRNGKPLAVELQNAIVDTGRTRFASHRLKITFPGTKTAPAFSHNASSALLTHHGHYQARSGGSRTAVLVESAAKSAAIGTLDANVVSMDCPASRTRNVSAVVRMIFSQVLAIGFAQFKIFQAVVVGVAVLVMNAFARTQRPTNRLGHNEPVIKLVFVADPSHGAAVSGQVVILPEAFSFLSGKAASAFTNVAHASIIPFKEVDNQHSLQKAGASF